MIKLYVLAAALQLVWGLTPSASKLILEYLSVESYSAIRYSFSGFIFLVVTLVKHRSLRLQLRDLPFLVTLGLLAYSLNSLGTLYGLKIGGVLNFALASSLNGIITATVAILLLKEKVGKYFIPAALFSLIGGFFLSWGKYDLSSLKIAGLSILLILGAYVFEALGFVYSKKMKARYPLTEYLAYLQLSAGIFMWILCASTNNLPREILAMPLTAWSALGFVVIFSCGICYFLLYWLLNHIEGHKLAFFDCFHTLAAALFGVLFFGDSFNLKMLIGGILLLFAVILVTIQKSTTENIPASTYPQ